MQADTLEERYAINTVINLEKLPQNRTECFRLLFDHLTWIEHQFLRGIRHSRKAGCLWGRMRGVGGVRKSEHQSWLAKGLGFKSGPWHFHQDNAAVHNSISITDYLKKMGIKTVSHPPYSPDVTPCYFGLFPMLRGQEDVHGASRSCCEIV